MLMDKRTEFSDAESLILATGTHLIGDVIDLGVASRNIGVSMIYGQLIAASAILAAAPGTIQFILASDAQAAIATDGSATAHFTTGTFITDVTTSKELTDGDRIAQFQLPLNGGAPYERYLGILAVIATQAVTAGTLDAFMTLDPTAWQAYADAAN